MLPAIADKLATLPDAPGVYLMKDATGEVFYVGKAKSLRDRVRSYFSGSDTRAFVALLDKLLADLEVVLTHTHKEAMLLENELIKAHRPRFNVKLTDDKRFLCLRLDSRHPYPKLQVVRRFAKDGARYFGPYHSARAIREALRIINRHFQLRTCTDQVLASRQRPCLQHQIKRCPAPCVFDLSGGTYQQNVTDVAAFLEGRCDDLVQNLTTRMHKHADAMEFEAAGALRDQIQAISHSLERQRMVTADFVQRDVVGLFRQGPAVEMHVMRTRQGRLIDARRYSSADTELPTAEVLADFAGRYYANTQDAIPDEILFPPEMEWSEPLAQLLCDRAGRTVHVLTPQRGDKRRLVELAARNAEQAYMDKQREAGAAKTAIERLQRALHLTHLPQTLECVDISHTQGTHIVASVVHFEGGAPRKSRYRRYKIRSIQGQDDFKSMYEVMSRRVRRGLENDDLPKLFVVDGGKGQLAAARAALVDNGVADGTVDIVGLAKSRLLESAATPSTPKIPREEGAIVDGTPNPICDGDELTAEQQAALNNMPPRVILSPHGGSAPRSAERVFTYGHKNPVVLRQNSAELFLLVRARDEAHRFAITFHRKLRQKSATRSALDTIAGVGPKRRRALLRTFGSVARLRQAGEQEVAAVVGRQVAAAVVAALNRPSNDLT